MLWVTAMYNVLVILSMADMVCLACMQKLWLCREILLLLNMADLDQRKTLE